MIQLTKAGEERVQEFLSECKAMRKEILDAGKDTAEETTLPTVADICLDMEQFADGDGYCNGWGVTDNYDSILSLNPKHYRRGGIIMKDGQLEKQDAEKLMELYKRITPAGFVQMTTSEQVLLFCIAKWIEENIKE